jgi:SAM-dependent methyltransferase
MQANSQRTERPASSWQRQGQESLAALTRREPLRAWASTTTDLPWGDQEFSERMLHEHLDQSHDLASRRLAVVEEQVTWLVERLGLSAGDRLLDLACGPGLYAAELGRRGVVVTGIDVSPAAIREARARCAGLPCDFTCADMRSIDLSGGCFDAALILFGQLAVQPPADVEGLLVRVRAGLARSGRLVVEVADASMLDRSSTSTWWTGANDLWGAGEHLVLHERGWDGDAEAVVDRFHVVDLASGRVEVFGVSERLYPAERLATVLAAAGFSPPAVHPAWDGISPDALGDWVIAVAEPQPDPISTTVKTFSPHPPRP